MSKSNSNWTRRNFLEFLGKGSLSGAVLSAVPLLSLSCATHEKRKTRPWKANFISPTSVDDLVVAEGIQKKILIKWKDLISTEGLEFGTNNDHCAFIPKDPKKPTEGVLMVNHEFVNPLFVSSYDESKGKSKTREQVLLEQKSVGVSLLRFYFDGANWKIDTRSPLNRRITGETMIPLVSKFPIEGQREAKGTFANCAGGITPWGTFLTCEENYDHFYGEWDYSPKPGTKAPRKSPKRIYSAKDLGWSRFEDCPPTHYGWVVEINPWTGAARKLTSLGRFSHEAATCTVSKNGRAVVYMGDDAPNQHLYKFISDSSTSLESGTLYVAQLESGRWLPITLDSHPEFRTRFKNETDLLVRTREAAKILGGTPLSRPEDIEINPANGDIIIALTNNHLTGDHFGSLLKIEEDQKDPGSLRFRSSQWIAGGPNSGLSCPDNLVFDKSGNLWCTNDIADDKLNKPPYNSFKNNGLYFIPMHGANAGKVFQVASSPVDSEITGPMFTPDGNTLIISIQHPGDQTKDAANPTSRWPDGGMPKSAVVALSGETIEYLVHYKG